MTKTKELEMLEYCIRLTYCGMPPAYIRFLMLRKHLELLEELKNSQAQNEEGEEWRGERP